MDRQLHKMQYEQILDDSDQLIQISTVDGFSMMYANEPARVFTNHKNLPYREEKCYKYMMGLEEQCPFCPMRNMEGKDVAVTEIDNGVQVFNVKTKRISWEGKDAFIEYATDITMAKRAQRIFESQMQTLVQSISEAQGIFHLNLTKDQWISSNGASGNIEAFQNMQSVDALFASVCEYIPDHKMQEVFNSQYRRNQLISSYERGKSEIVMEVLSYYEDRSIRWTRLTARMIMNPNTNDLECIFYGMDINEEKTYLERMSKMQKEKNDLMEKSKKDMLTNVYSKKTFEEMMSVYMKECQNETFALVFLDLDHFKDVNDTLGHMVGDQAIINTADRLQTMFSNKDVISRFGGDEFCILVKNISEDVLIDKMEFMLKELRISYHDGKNTVNSSASVGVLWCKSLEEKNRDVRFLLQEADVALYQAKRKGRDQYCLRILTS